MLFSWSKSIVKVLIKNNNATQRNLQIRQFFFPIESKIKLKRSNKQYRVINSFSPDSTSLNSENRALSTLKCIIRNRCINLSL